ncbi:MAG: helix-turn-helix domain-containing protein [Acidimicrobiales bacterium]|nr:helix-turn-helix domain-containing protein [Acidimicrobiales bacterium]
MPPPQGPSRRRRPSPAAARRPGSVDSRADTRADTRADAPADASLDRSLARAAEVVGDRWSLLVVSRLLPGPRRFGELLGELDGLAPNILARRLASLEGDGLVVGEPYTTRPVRHAYRLTARGAGLAGTLRMLAGWAAPDQAGPGEAAAVHDVCGTPLEARWFCGTCDAAVEDPAPGCDPGESEGLLWL